MLSCPYKPFALFSATSLEEDVALILKEDNYIYSMPVKRTILKNHGTYFITFTCYNWLPLIKMIDGFDIIYSWFDYLKSKGHFINGYVIMHNHVHLLIGFTNTSQSINYGGWPVWTQAKAQCYFLRLLDFAFLLKSNARPIQ